MLISRRKEGEIVRIGEGIEVRIVSVRKKKVILGIIAPHDVRITAGKLTDAEMATTMAAVNSIELADFLHTPRSTGEKAVFLLDAAWNGENDLHTADKTMENQHEQQ
jgi:carbon storage regulator CsrA